MYATMVVCVTNSGMTPYLEDGGDSGVRLQKKIPSPFFPADRHITILIHPVHVRMGKENITHYWNVLRASNIHVCEFVSVDRFAKIQKPIPVLVRVTSRSLKIDMKCQMFC